MGKHIETSCLHVGQETLPYELERKKIKRLNLRVRRDGTVHVSAPVQMSMRFIEDFLREKRAWIQNALARANARAASPLSLVDGEVIPIEGVPHTLVLQKGKQGARRLDGVLILTVRDPLDGAERARVFRRFVSAEASRVLTDRTKAIYPYFASRVATFPTLSFRWMKSRWGSCTAAKNHITLNEKLLFVAPALADYVIFHEFCHFRYQDHSAAFYAHLASFLPDHQARRRALRAIAVPELSQIEKQADA
jgi:predicted metal-dependent hydrolase